MIEKLYYEPFGARQDVNGDPVAAPNKDVLFGFATHRHDDELGLIDMRGRVYDPMNRRFLTPDPIVSDPLSGQDYNRYSYVANNPINLNDPSGFETSSGSTKICFLFFCVGGDEGGGKAGGTAGGGGSGAQTSSWYQYGGRVVIHVPDPPKPTSTPIGPTAPPSPGGSSVMGPSDNWAAEAFGGAFDAWNHHAAGAAGMLLDVFAPQARVLQAGWGASFAGAAFVREYMQHGGSGVLALAKSEVSGKVAGLSGAAGGLYGLGLEVYNGDPGAGRAAAWARQQPRRAAHRHQPQRRPAGVTCSPPSVGRWMMTTESWAGLHDATLESMELRWPSGEAVLRIRTGDPMHPQRVVVASAVRLLGCDRQLPWGFSVSINEVRGPAAAGDDASVLEIEMQSGDLIRIEAVAFSLRDAE